MFRIVKSCRQGLASLKLLNTLTNEYVSILPDFGGNVNELVLRKDNKNHQILDGNLTRMDIFQDDLFKGAKLTPFANRIKGGKYRFNGKNYQFPVNQMGQHAIHGFLYDKGLHLTHQAATETSAMITLNYEHNGKTEGYPFKFYLKMTYSLNRKGEFKCTTEFQNIDNQAIPFSDGWHPYFKMNSSIENLYLAIPAKFVTKVDKQLIPTGLRIPAKAYTRLHKIGQMTYDTSFQLASVDHVAVTGIYDPETDICIQIWQETGKGKYNYLQVFIPPSRASIAIEPMSSNVNAFNNEDGLIVLQPREMFIGSYGVRLSGKPMNLT